MQFDLTRISVGLKIKALIILYHALFLFGLFHLQLHWLLVGLASYFFFGKMGAEIGLHRYFAHRSFQAHPMVEKLLFFLAIGAGLGSPISWAATHRLHHRFADTPRDPHSPLFQKKWKVWLTLWPHFLVPRGMVSDLAQQPAQRFVHKNYFLLHGLAIMCLGLMDPLLPCFVLAWPSVLSFHLAGAVNALCHRSDGIVNLSWLNVLGLGDALHSNHHSEPGKSTTASVAHGGFDLSGSIIRVLETPHNAAVNLKS